MFLRYIKFYKVIFVKFIVSEFLSNQAILLSYCVFFQLTEDTENIDILPTAGMVAIIFKQFSIKSQLNKAIIANKTKNSRSRGPTWPQRVKHVNSKTNDEKMFFALHFIQVGKLHDPSKLLLQPYKLTSNCVRLRNI